ncbi:mannose-6-phosphate isomerase, class I [Staphylococcus massiliensis]|uniref:Mannose-6-phosphate isomerase n=1 Tax=Staphylococcus massiliensis S46 TaxID=1229783 RepID=K9AW17_9STAP|nr:mannose-6-phosphate isomerase, class I [Staphylococcus massiliensis]EKU45700.1 mannose-6-phosphate isomerase [Staphylococcus massiliensis S46]MCG3400209.1 mannose-6-phosphate isomerase, class I [Staphylococcus massiliensis]MCG3413232.1 mannose-6-phosphate isomerase, class I [Staphylococcus massiliensis]PNZ96895.1 mannose-6-phosphate isomerase, class I [Staphylococcus massiliensis CCUG 55927]
MPLFLEPIFQERIWGGSRLKQFNYDIPSDHTGECWGISALPNGANKIIQGPFKGQTLDEVWASHRELFGDFPSKRFPLLTKILDAHDKLSVQVHPDDNYAYEHENGEFGKTECWYIIDAKEDAEIIYGTTATDKASLNEMIDNQDFDQLFKKINVKPGEFYYVPAGTVHGIGEGIMILETQQSSDTTYRIYDYDRVDKDGNKRDLHLDKSKDVITLGNESPNVIPETDIIENQKRTTFVNNEFFTVSKWEISGTLNYMKPREFCLVTVLEGEGQVISDGVINDIKKGDHFILTSENLDNVFEGELTLIISFI